MKKFIKISTALLCAILLAGCSPTGNGKIDETTPASQQTAEETTAAETTAADSTATYDETREEQTVTDETAKAYEEETTADCRGAKLRVYSLTSAGRDEKTGYYEYDPEIVHAGTDINYQGKGENAKYTIVIDAGHQLTAMTDTEPNSPSSSTMKIKVAGGTTGKFTKIPEYQLNLTVALTLRDELVFRGYSVVMVRETNDVRISNAERAQIANKYNAAANIRIHANGVEDQQICGAIGMCQTENNPDNANIYIQCRVLTEQILSEYCNATGMKYGTILENDTMTGTNWSKVPTTIIEMGYMSNKADDEKMAEADFRISAAVGIADGIEKFLSLGLGEETSPAEQLEFEDRDETVTATENVWIRIQPSTNGGDATKYKVLKAGETITRTGYNDSWSRVSYEGRTYYVSSKYLK